MSDFNTYEGVVLAAGYSTRMNNWKPGVKFNHIPLIVHTVKTMLEVCNKVNIVGGFNFEKLKAIFYSNNYLEDFQLEKINVIENHKFMEGMLSSVQFGIEQVSIEAKGVFIIPGDIPFVKSSTYYKLIDCFGNDEENEVVIPITLIKPEKKLEKAKLKKGHPILINKYVCSQIVKSEEIFVLREILEDFNQNFCFVEDNAIVFDIDNSDDLAKANIIFGNEINYEKGIQ